MSKNKKGISLIAVVTILILVIIAGVIFVIYQLGVFDDNADTNQNTTSNVTNNNSTPDTIAKELFEKGTDKLIDFAANPATDVIGTDFGDVMADPIEEKTAGDDLFHKTTLTYRQAEDKYGEIFTGEALNGLMSRNFLDVNGTLYANTVGGGSGFEIRNLKVTYISQSNGKYTYKATFNETEVFGENETLGASLTKEFVIEKVGDDYRISSIEYTPNI